MTDLTRRAKMALRTVEAKHRRANRIEAEHAKRFKMPLEFDPRENSLIYPDGKPILPDDPRANRRAMHLLDHPLSDFGYARDWR